MKKNLTHFLCRGQRNKWHVSLLGLILCLLIGGLYSIAQGQDNWWDLLNYHLYNGFAFVTGRTQDLFVAGDHSTLNPLLDVIYYWFFSHLLNYPRLMAFVMGFPYGIAVWLIYQIVYTCWQGTYKIYWALLITVCAGTSAGIFSQVGVCSHEVPITACLLGGFLCFAHFVRSSKHVYLAYVAAFIYGAVTGTKLTAAPFAVGLFAAFLEIAFRSQKTWRSIFCFIIWGILGFLATNGYFMWKLWQEWQNPVFPYMNDIFKSTYHSTQILTDYRFYPRSVWQLLFYPFYWAWKPVNLIVSEESLCDARLAIGYICVLLGGWWVFRGRKMVVSRSFFISLVLFTVVSYLSWMLEFSILRYAGMLEIAACMLIGIVIASIWKEKKGILLGLFLLVFLTQTTVVPTWSHTFFHDQILQLSSQPKIEDNALVFLMQNPTSYLVPALNPKASYMGGFQHRATDYPAKYAWEARSRNYPLPPQYYFFYIEEKQSTKIAQHEGPIYILTTEWPLNLNPTTLARFGLAKPDIRECQYFHANLEPSYISKYYSICRVEKLTAKDVR